MRAAIVNSHRNISSNMTHFLSGVRIAFAELSSDSKPRVLFTKQVTAAGGSVMAPRPGAFFGSKGQELVAHFFSTLTVGTVYFIE